MGDMLEFNEIYQEVKGSWNDGRLRFSKQNVVYKSNKTGKVDNIPAGELNQAQWRRVCLGHGIKLGTSTGHIYKYDGFRDTDFEKLSEFFKLNYKVELSEKDMSVKGWNWGTAKFSGKQAGMESLKANTLCFYTVLKHLETQKTRIWFDPSNFILFSVI
uniref:FACT complex subunit SSRP1/POB3 N-terminal PH domain-containing protein n=1 Tax=Poecilia latipinna TaxID=48699 RepID=A0A3B3UGB0_9TELE